jgi:hypothetical protein
VTGAGFALLAAVVGGYAWLCARQRARSRVQSALNNQLMIRAIRANGIERSLERARAENNQLTELARKRHELLRAACLALDVTIPDPPRDTELVQGIRAAATVHGRQLATLRVEVELRDVALAALASMILMTSVAPGQYDPRELVHVVDAHLAAWRSQA